jgi:hypothetical protein
MTTTTHHTLGDIEIPVRQRVTEAVLPDGYYLARSLIEYTDRNEQPNRLPGFSFGRDREQCRRVSGYEAIERLAATYDFQSAVLNRDTAVPGHKWQTGKFTTVPFDRVLIQNNAPSELAIDTDATGLAYHHDREAAISHAVCELLERALFARIWWQDESLLRIGDGEDVGRGYTFRKYCVDAEPTPPFVLGTVENPDERVWVCGSALDQRPEEAIEHAKEECCMLLDNHFSDNENLVFQSDTAKESRLQSMQSNQSSARRDHIRAKCSGSVTAFHPDGSLADVFDTFDLVRNVDIATLWEDDSHCVVRATCDDITGVHEVRRNSDADVPSDIFL